MAVDIESVRAAYEQERPRFEQLAEAAADMLRREGTIRRIPYRVEHRAKEMHSLLKKALFERIKYKKIIDRAGVRLVLRSVQDVEATDGIIRTLFKVHRQVDVGDKLGEREFGYGGIHYHLEFLEPPPGLEEMRLECQLHTRAQAMWASLSHELAYKSNSSGPHIRSLHRLAALLELVDLEVVRIQEQARDPAGDTAVRVGAVLEAHYLTIARRRYSPSITSSLVPKLLLLMGTEDADAWQADFESFMTEHADRIADIYKRYSEDTRHLMMSQPESLLVLYARQRDPYSFDELWPEDLGEGLKEAFVGIWPNP